MDGWTDWVALLMAGVDIPDTHFHCRFLCLSVAQTSLVRETLEYPLSVFVSFILIQQSLLLLLLRTVSGSVFYFGSNSSPETGLMGMEGWNIRKQAHVPHRIKNRMEWHGI